MFRLKAGAHSGHAFRYRFRIRVVDVGVSRWLQGGTRSTQDFHGSAVVQRQHVVLLRLDEPGVDQYLEFLRVLVGEVLRLRPVLLKVVEFPFVLVETALAGNRGMDSR